MSGMTERTYTELADALEKHAGRSSFQPYRTFERDDLREAAQKLRDMPEGERTNVFVDPISFREINAKEGFGMRWWTVVASSPFDNNTELATLILHTRKEVESK